MSRTYHHGKYSIKENTRYKKLGRAVIRLAKAEQEKEAEQNNRKKLQAMLKRGSSE